MTRLSPEEREDFLAAGPSLTRSMQPAKAGSRSFRRPDGSMDLRAVVSFLNQANALIGHRRKPFEAIRGERFLL